MAITGEGTIEIPLEDFWKFLNNYHNHKGDVLVFGVPKTDIEGQCIIVNYAYDSIDSPQEWLEKPKCLKEWKQE